MSGKPGTSRIDTIMPFDGRLVSCVDAEREEINEMSDEEILEVIRNLTMQDVTVARVDALFGVAMSRETIQPAELQQACQDAHEAYQTMFAGQTCPIRFPEYD